MEALIASHDPEYFAPLADERLQSAGQSPAALQLGLAANMDTLQQAS
ncbi:MAG: hypothetical protein R3E95_02745 [Thiolinea sp.]